MARKPPPEGYAWHPTIPGLLRKIEKEPEPSAAAALYPHLKSADETLKSKVNQQRRN